MKTDPEFLTNQILKMGKISFEFARTKRISCREDGVTRESNTDHSFMLALIAGSFADSFVPRLDRGRVVEFALLHDLVEVYAGDVPTFKALTPKQKRAKEEAERKALLKIQEQFGETFPWIHKTIEEYERKDTPEARFVKVFDKLVPKINHIFNNAAEVRRLGFDRDFADEFLLQQQAWAEEHLEEWPEVKEVWNIILERNYKAIQNC